MNRTYISIFRIITPLLLLFGYCTVNADHVLPAADLELIKTVDNPFPEVGDQVSFTVLIRNQGPLDATDIVVHAYVKNGFSSISNISHSGTVSNDTISWTLDSILDNQSTALSYDVIVNAPFPGVDYDNTAQIFALHEYDRDSEAGNGVDPDNDGLIGSIDNNPNDGSFDPDGEDDSDNEPVHPMTIDLSLIKIVSDNQPYIGDTVLYSIIIENDGDNDATGVQVLDSLPDALINIHDISNGGSLQNDSILWSNLSIPTGANLVLSFLAEVQEGTHFRNLAEINAANEYDVDSTPGNGADTDNDNWVGPLDDDDSKDLDDEDDGDDATINPKRIDLSLVKSVNIPNPRVGSFASFTITVTNSSPFTATGVEITDYIPDGYGTIQNISSNGVLNNDIMVWSNITIDPFTFATLSFDAEVLSPDNLDYVNIAEVTAADQTDMDSTPGNGADTDDDGLIGPIDDDGSQDPDDEDDGDDAVVIPCQIEASIEGPSEICFGECVDLTVSTNNGYGTVSILWANGLGDQATITVCPDSDTSFEVMVTDQEGCDNSASFDIHVKCIDELILAVVGAEDYFDCNASPNFGQLEIEGNCRVISEEFSDDFSSNECPVTAVRLWTVIDECGRSYTISQLATSKDDLAPTLNILPADITVSCPEDVPGHQDVTTIDNCDDDPSLDFDQSTIPNCEEGVIYNTWISSDCYGNTSSHTQIVTIKDSIAPEFNIIPEDITTSCDDIPIALSLIATDNCGELIDPIFNEEITNLDCPNNYDINRSWTATDCSGNNTVANQLISVRDNTPPSISGIADDGTFSCDEDPDFSDPVATDDCGVATLSYYDSISSGNCGDIVTRKWTATDACGNTTTASQVMTQVDTTGPVIMVTNGTFECGSDPVFSDPVVNDNCGTATLSFTESSTSSSCSDLLIVRIWIATDECGNTSSAIQTMESIDDEPPVITGVMGDGEYQCGTDAVFSEPSAMDNCSSPTLTFVDSNSGANCAGPSILRVWTATDSCGNTSTAWQTMVAIDTIAPSFPNMDDSSFFECGTTPIYPDVVATDDCSEISITLTEEFETGGCAGPSIVLTWLATDECGNTSQISHKLIPQDTQAPIISGVADNGFYDCDTLPHFSEPIVTDLCSEVSISFIDTPTTGTCAGPGTMRTWTALDDCGNVSIASQILEPEDLEGPIITEIGMDGTYECGEDPVFELPIAVDNCSAINFEFRDSIGIISCATAETVRIWTLTDECGNTTTATQSMLAIDTQAPQIENIGDDASFDCDSGPAFSQASATDECSAVSLQFSDDTLYNDCKIIISRTWIATDECGNESSETQTMESIDTLAPILSGIGPDGQFLCGDMPIFSDPVTSDNCSAVSLSFTDESQNNNCDVSVTRTWVAVDECGNTTTDSQTMHSVDDQAPVFINVGTDTSYLCGSALNFTTPDITDCTMVSTTFTDEIIDTNCAGDIIKRCWEATDECGNTASHCQTLTPIDTIPPVFSEIDTIVYFSCGEQPPFSDPTATDNCSDVEISYINFPGSKTCTPDGVLRIWTATDECGNSSTISQTLFPVDTVGPEIIGVGPGGSIECNETPVYSEPIAEDLCTSAYIEFSDTLNRDDCKNIMLTRIWTATDACGNTSTASETFSYADTIAPEIAAYDFFLFFNCDETIEFPDLVAVDRCSAITIDYVDSPGDENCFGYNVMRNWTVTDECGNVSTALQVATVYDDEAPVILPIQDTIYRDCSLAIEFEEIDASDNCSEVTIEYTDVQLDNLCTGYEYIRTWVVTDICGNTASTIQTLIQFDTLSPIIDNIGDNGFYDCADDPEFSIPFISDNCSDFTIDVEDTPTAGTCAGSGITRTWTVTDDCGNTQSASQTLEPQDITAPVISGTDQIAVIECGDDFLYCGSLVPSKIEFDFNNCRSYAINNTDQDYSEFFGQIINGPSGVIINNGVLYRNNPAINIHSCTPGINGSQAMCVDSYDSCNYDPFSDKAVIIDINVDPSTNAFAILHSISFYQKAPEQFDFTSGAVGDNNYPTLYGIRILINGVEQYREMDIGTSVDWSLESFKLINENISVSSTSIITIELLPYCLFGNGATVSAWDLEQLEVVFNNQMATTCVAATDNCLDYTLDYTDSSGNYSCAGAGIIRTWTAVDDCGNVSTAEQSIQLIDSTPPVIFGIDNDGEYACGESPNFSVPWATDNCSAVSLNFTDDVLGKITTRTWIAVDECGNVTEGEQSMTEQNCIVDLELDKSVSTDEASLGETIYFTIEVFNNSDFTAHNVIVLDKLKSGFHYLSSTLDQGSYNANTGLWLIGDIQAYQTISLTIEAWVQHGDSYINEALIVSLDETDIDSDPNNRVDTDLDGDISDDPDDEDDGDGVIVIFHNNYEIKIYPQPISNTANLEIYSADENQLSWNIYSTTGKIVKKSKLHAITQGSHSFPLELSELADGTYMIRVQIGRHLITKKIIVLHR